MQDLMDFRVAEQAVWDPLTSASELMLIAQYHPSLRGAVLSHPHADEGLVEWLRDQPVVRIAEQEPVVPNVSRSGKQVPRRGSRVVLIIGVILVAVALVGAAIVVVNVWDAGPGEPTPTVSTEPTTTSAEPITGELYTFSGAHSSSYYEGIVVDDEGVIYTGGLEWDNIRFPTKEEGRTGIWTVIDRDGQMTATQTDVPAPRVRLKDGFLVVNAAHTTFAAVDATGTVLWRNPDPTIFANVWDFAVSEDGSIAVMGINAAMEAVIALLNADGVVLWARSYRDYVWKQTGLWSVEFFPDGSLCITGNSVDGNRLDALVLILDPQGNIVTTRVLAGTASSLGPVRASPDGTVVGVGHMEMDTEWNDSDALVMKIDASGEIVWVEYFGGSGWDYFTDIAMDSSGEIFVVGGTRSSDGDFVQRPVNGVQGEADAVIAHVDPGGSLVWAQVWAGIATEELRFVSVNAGRVCAAGYTHSWDSTFRDSGNTNNGLIICVAQA